MGCYVTRILKAKVKQDWPYKSKLFQLTMNLKLTFPMLPKCGPQLCFPWFLIVLFLSGLRDLFKGKLLII